MPGMSGTSAGTVDVTLKLRADDLDRQLAEISSRINGEDFSVSTEGIEQLGLSLDKAANEMVAIMDTLSDNVMTTFSALSNSISQLLETGIRGGVNAGAESLVKLPKLTAKLTTSDYQNEISRTVEQLDRLNAKIEELRQKDGSNPTLDKMMAQSEQLVIKIRTLEDELNRLNAGGIVNTGEKTSEAFGKIGKSVDSVRPKIGDFFGSFGKGAGKLGDILFRSAGSVLNLGKNLLGLGSGARSSSQHFRTLRMSMMALLGARSVFALLRRGISGLNESIAAAGRQFPIFGAKLNALGQSVAQLKGAFATMFLPLLNSAMPIFNTVLNAATRLFSTIAIWIARLAGQKSALVSVGGITAQDASQMNAVAKATDAANKKKAEQVKENEKLKRSLAGFDEIQILSFDKNQANSNDDMANALEDAIGGGGGDIKAGAVYQEIPVKPLIVSDWKLFGSDLASKINGAIELIDAFGIGTRLGEKIQKGIDFAYGFLDTLKYNHLGSKVATILNFTFAGINFFRLGQTLAQGLNVAIYTAFDFVTTFNWKAFGTKVGAAINGFFKDHDFKKDGELITEFILGILDFMISVVKTTDWKAVGRKIGELVSKIDWKEILKKAKELLKIAVSGMLDAISEAIKENDPDGKLTPFVNFLKSIGNWMAENPDVFIKFALGAKAISALFGAISTVVGITKGFSNFLSLFSKGAGDAATFSAGVEGAGTSLLSFGGAGGTLATVAEFIAGAACVLLVIGAIKSLADTWEDHSAAMKKNVQSLKDSFKDFGEAVSSILNGDFSGGFNFLKSSFANMGDAIIGILEQIMTALANTGIAIANFFGVNQKYLTNKDVQSGLGSIFKTRAQSDLAYIRGDNGFFKEDGKKQSPNQNFRAAPVGAFARGGIVEQPQLALIGEAGREAVIPLENNTGWITDLASKIAHLNGAGSQSGVQNVTIPVYLGTDTLIDVVKTAINRDSRLRNAPAFEI